MDKLPNGWETKKLKEVCIIRPPKSEVKDLRNIKVSFVPMATVNEHQIGFDASETKTLEEVYSGYTYFKDNDILLAKVTPCFENGKSAIARNLVNGIGFGSSEFYVLRPHKSILPEWIYRVVSSQNFINEGKQNMSGAVGLKRVTQDFISSYDIPIPPFSEQTRIISRLDALFSRIDKSIALLEENIKHTKGLMASVLEELFVNGKNWKREPLNKVAKVERGKSKHRPRNDLKLFGDSYPFIQTGDVRSAKKYIDKYEVCYSEFGLKQSRLWNKGTICLTIAANIGDVAILGFDACFPDSVVGITPYSMNNEFLYYYLKTLQLQLDKKANSAAQKNINLKILSEIDVPVPSIEIQNSIADRFSRLEEKQFQILAVQQSKLTYLKALKSSLLDRAFKGDL